MDSNQRFGGPSSLSRCGEVPIDVTEFVAHNGGRLLAYARKFSSTAADAEDAYQRALEKLLTKAPIDRDDDELMAWLMTVVRNEALLIQRANQRIAIDDFEAAGESMETDVGDPQERLLDLEGFDAGREALRGIRPESLRCLLLRADGHGIPEICEITGFSYPKVNRLLTEGRRAFRERVTGIESGVICRKLQPILSLIADGLASERARSSADIHLQHCLRCQATLRAYSTAPREIAAFLPLGLEVATVTNSPMDRLTDAFNALTTGVQERFASLAPAVQFGSEASFAKKAVALSAIAASLATGGVTIEQIVDAETEKPASPPVAISPTPAIGEPATKPSATTQEMVAGHSAPRAAETTDALRATSAIHGDTRRGNAFTDGTAGPRQTGVVDPDSVPLQTLDEPPADAGPQTADPGLVP